MSTSLSLSSDGLKDYREHIQARKDQDDRKAIAAEQKEIHESVSMELTKSLEISKNLDSALRTLSSTSETVQKTAKVSLDSMREARRSAAPLSLKDLSAEVELVLPGNNVHAQSYLTRVHPAIQVKANFGLGDFGFPQGGSIEERPLFSFVTQMYIDLNFIRKVPKSFSKTNSWGDLDMIIFCNEGKNVVTPGFKPEGDPYEIRVRCDTRSITISKDNGTIRSFVDLVGSTVYANFYCDYCGDDIYGSLLAPELRTIRLTTSDNRGFDLTFYGKTTKDCPIASPCFTTDILETSLWITR